MSKLIIKNMPELPYSVEEAVNRLRVNISFLGNDVKRIMVISSLPNEGKSFVTMQLWHQMAEAGTKSVFVDMDLRKSVLSEKYELSLDDKKEIKGTSHYLASDYPLSEAIYKTDLEYGDFMPNVDNVINPSMLLESERFEQMLKDLKKNIVMFL